MTLVEISTILSIIGLEKLAPVLITPLIDAEMKLVRNNLTKNPNVNITITLFLSTTND